MTYQPDDLNSVKLLICYLLFNLDAAIDSEALYEIAVDSGIINYFYYNEAMDDLIFNDTIYSVTNENGKVFFSISKKGKVFVKKFSKYVQLSFRKRLMYSAIQYRARQLKNANLSIDYQNSETGCTLHCSISDNDKNLIDLKLFTQSETQAELIAERISEEPSEFYSSFIDFVINKKNPDNDENSE